MRTRPTTLIAALLLAFFGVSHTGAAECLWSVCAAVESTTETTAETPSPTGHCHPPADAAVDGQTERSVAPAAATLEHGCCGTDVLLAPRSSSVTPPVPDIAVVPSAVAPRPLLTPATLVAARAPPGTTRPLFRLHRALLL